MYRPWIRHLSGILLAVAVWALPSAASAQNVLPPARGYGLNFEADYRAGGFRGADQYAEFSRDPYGNIYNKGVWPSVIADTPAYPGLVAPRAPRDAGWTDLPASAGSPYWQAPPNYWSERWYGPIQRPKPEMDDLRDYYYRGYYGSGAWF